MLKDKNVLLSSQKYSSDCVAMYCTEIIYLFL